MAKAKPKTTHEFTERAVNALVRVLEESSAQQPPSGDLLVNLRELLDVHHQGTPAASVDERLSEIVARLERVEKQVAVRNLKSR